MIKITSPAKNEPWYKIAAEVLARLLLMAALGLPLGFIAWMLTMLMFFHSEHPFITHGHSDYEKMPEAFGTYVSVPFWFLYGGFAGLVSAQGTARAVQVAFLVAWGVLLTALCLLLPDVFGTHHRPAWVPVVAALGAAIRASQFFVQRAQKRSHKTTP